MANIQLTSDFGKGKIKKIDSRMNGYMMFSHVWIPDQTARIVVRAKSFNVVRKWCKSTWGSSCELESYEIFSAYQDQYDCNQELNSHWAWDYYCKRGPAIFKIFLKSEKEMNWFIMRWS